MKRIVIIIALLAISIAANAQTGIYKKYEKRPNVQAYCVERYPLGDGYTASVTMLQTVDTTVYKALRKELQAMPFTPTREILRASLDIMINPAKEPGHKLTDKSKSLEISTADGLPGDDGYYMFFFPSDRMIVLAFLVKDTKEQIEITMRMLATEF